ncbi:MAG: MarR family transcriptional regulator [Actinophytocola sp.]|uniref:MarR family winged helix-turn-helix transcriptional regulator n=1 Tax=Actinophytocola sp. TaxID=1872138 RepID=UPI001322D83C|nr:MarR family transcriptional regulator [Actinophytocola sp.]MPZ86347.1 MarR family transcriptional regulator [Actinophytocola sp.]
MIEKTVAYALLKGMKATRGAISPVLAERGLHPGQDLMLSALWREDGVSQAELVARLGIEAPTVSKALQRLEKVGYVRREAGRGRSRRVYLTEKGHALRRPVEQAWRNADRRLSRRLGGEDMATLRRILSRLTQE